MLKKMARPVLWRPKLWSGHNWTVAGGLLLPAFLPHVSGNWNFLRTFVVSLRGHHRQRARDRHHAAGRCKRHEHGLAGEVRHGKGSRQTNKDNRRVLPQPEPRIILFVMGLLVFRAHEMTPATHSLCGTFLLFNTLWLTLGHFVKKTLAGIETWGIFG